MKGKIFNAQEVQAILNGSKTMFREVFKKPLNFDDLKVSREKFLCGYNNLSGWYEEISNVRCPYQVGQKIFCKEKFKERLEGIYYSEDEVYFRKGHLKVAPYKKAQQMKQEQSRITLQIKSIGVENLSEISDEDIFAEGIEFYKHTTLFSPKEHFVSYWNATHKKPEEKWEANPSVFVYNFEVVK